jgi:hypothetical protein
MRFRRFAGRAAGVAALFYCSVAGVCQSIPAQPGASGAAAAADRISIHYVATGAKAGEVPASCGKILAVLVPYIQAYPHPSGWEWYVACDEAAWARIQLRQGNQVGSGILAITNRAERSTIIRGSAMVQAYSDDFRAQPEHIVAHELCHIYLESSDESKVDELATRWVAERRAKRVASLRP